MYAWRQLGILQLGLPQQADGRVQDDGVEPFGVEQLQPLVRIHAAERRLGEVGAGRILLDRRQVRRTHRAERRREAAAAHHRALAADLQLLETLLVDAEPQRPIAILRIDVVLPDRGRFEDVAVGVDGAGMLDPTRLVHRLAHRHSILFLSVGDRSSIDLVTPSSGRHSRSSPRPSRPSRPPTAASRSPTAISSGLCSRRSGISRSRNASRPSSPPIIVTNMPFGFDQVGVDRARTHGVDRDPRRAELDRHRLRERDHGRLRRRVGADHRPCLLARLARHVADPPRNAAGEHPRRTRLRDQPGAGDVDVEHASELAVGQADERSETEARPASAGDVGHQRDRAERDVAASTASSTAAASDTSARTPTARPPSASISATRLSRSSDDATPCSGASS